MNRGKRALTKTVQKKMKKEVHKAQKAYATKTGQDYSEQLTEKEMLKKFPKKAPKKQKTPRVSTKKATTAKTVTTKKVHKKKVSKRTTPGTVASDSTPAYPHKEGGRWAKVLQKQTQATKKIQQRRPSTNKK